MKNERKVPGRAHNIYFLVWCGADWIATSGLYFEHETGHFILLWY
jgi:hypothetical protein